MLTYDISKAGKMHLYEYICRCIKNDIKSGVIEPGEKFPSKREFARNLGVSIVTVETAYDQLEAEGFIYSVPRRGFFAAAPDEGAKRPVKKSSDPKKSGKTHAPRKVYMADFAGRSTESTLFPFTTWTSVIREVLNDSRIDLMAAPPCNGAYELRDCITQYLREFRGMNVSPEQVVIGAGTEYLYGLLVQLLGSDKTYAVENPGYKKAEQICENHNAKCVRIRMDENGLIPAELEKKHVNIAHVTPSHQFPTGIVMPKKRRKELINWANAAADRYIVEDDYDSELRLSGSSLSPLYSMDNGGRVIYMNTFTRTLCHTIRMSYMILPADLADRFIERLSFYSCTVSNFEQYTLAAFMRSGKFESHINRLKNHYRKKRDLLIAAIKEGNLGTIAEVSGDEAGLHFLLKINTKVPEETLIAHADAKGIRLVPLSGYGATGAKNTYVMSYAAVDASNAKEIMERIYNCSIWK